MNWLPPAPDFRAALRSAVEIGEPDRRLAALAALAGHRLSPLETIQLDRELAKLAPAAEGGARSARLALMSTATTEHLGPALRVAALRRGLRLEVHHGAFGRLRNEVFDAGSALYAFRPDFVLLSLGAHELLGDVALGASDGQARQATERAVEELAALWAALRAHGAGVVIQQNLLDTGAPLFGSFDLVVPGAPARLLAHTNLRLAEAASGAGIGLLDLAGAAARDGRDAWFDRGRWLQAKMEIAPQAAAAFGDRVARLIGAYRGLSRKCLVLDLDNTLWGGVIGDDGVEGIVLGEGSALGEAHLQLQRYAKALAARGVILAVCSKNDRAVAEQALREHPEMLLRPHDFAALAVNWQDKAENLRAIAAQLNIGLDSLVFVDDNPTERARVRAALPMVAVPELPPDPAGYVDCIAQAGYFEAVSFTDEDRSRSRQYADESRRAELRESAQSMDEFLAALAMQVEHGPVGPVQLERATQLVNKTNQFNTTTRRLSAAEMGAYLDDPARAALQFRLVDRLGDNGLVSVVLLSAHDGGRWQIDNWVMSCRVFGRQFEDEIMNIVVETVRARGAQTLVADYLPSERNTVVSGLFGGLGFEAESPAAPEGAPTRWRLRVADYAPRPTHIRRKGPP